MITLSQCSRYLSSNGGNSPGETYNKPQTLPKNTFLEGALAK